MLLCVFTMLIACGVFAYSVNCIGMILSDFSSREKEIKENLNNNNEIEIDNYNEKVRLLNSSKNTFFENFNSIQIQKKELIDKWQKLKSNFFKKTL